MRRLLGDRARNADVRFRVGSGILLGLALLSVVMPITSAGDPHAIAEVLATRLVPPFARDQHGALHWLGTDALGRDIAIRLWLAARISLGVGLAGSLSAATIGITLGAIAAWRGGVIERGILSISDALLAIPRLILLLVISSLWGPGIGVVVCVLALTGWMSVMRLVRADVLGVRRLPFVEAALSLGIAPWRVLWRHVLPNALGSATIAITLGIGNAIVLESGLSFLGLGIQPPAASWGNMIAGGREWLLIAPWIALVPGVLLVATVVACTLVGDALNDRRAAPDASPPLAALR